MQSVVLHVLVAPAGSNRRLHRWQGGSAESETAAVECDHDLVLLHAIADTSGHERELAQR